MRISLATLTVLLLTVPASAQGVAATADSAPIATINLAYVAERSVTGQATFRPLAELQRGWDAKLQAQRDALLEQQRQLQATASLQGAVRAQLERAFERNRLAFERLQEDARNDVLGLERQIADEFRAKLAPIVDALAKERGTLLLFDRDAPVILWVTPAVDLSDEVITRLDARP